MDEAASDSEISEEDFSDESSRSSTANNESSTTNIFSQHYNGQENVTNIHGNNQNIHLNVPNHCKDVKESLQFELKKRYLEKTPLQNIPWLQKSKFIDDLFIDLHIVKVLYNWEIYYCYCRKKLSVQEIFYHNKDEPKDFIKNIIIEAPVGKGKTTLCWYLAREWANNREFMKKFDFVFIIPLRELRNLTIHSYIHKEFQVADLPESKNVLFILDGLDEIQEKDAIFHEINEMNKKSNLCVILTSRPMEIDCINLKSFVKMKLLGFDEIGINEFIDQYFTEILGSHEIKAIKKKILDNHCIKELASCPLFLMLFCLLIENDPICYKFPESETELFKTTINFLVERQFNKNENQSYKKVDFFSPSADKDCHQYFKHFQNFSCLALKKLKKKKLNFNKKEIQNSKCELLIKLGLMIRIDDLNTENCYQMIHISFLEFFVGFYFKNLCSLDKTLFEREMEELVKSLYYRVTPSFFMKQIIQMENIKEDTTAIGITGLPMNGFSLYDSMIFPFVCGFLEDKLIAVTYIFSLGEFMTFIKTKPILTRRSFFNVISYPLSVNIIDKEEGIEKLKQKMSRRHPLFPLFSEFKHKIICLLIIVLEVLLVMLPFLYFTGYFNDDSCKYDNRIITIDPNGNFHLKQYYSCRGSEAKRLMKSIEAEFGGNRFKMPSNLPFRYFSTKDWTLLDTEIILTQEYQFITNETIVTVSLEYRRQENIIVLNFIAETIEDDVIFDCDFF